MEEKEADSTAIVEFCNVVTEGSDVLQEGLLSPFLSDIGDFEAYGYEKEIMYFGRVGDLLL